MTDPNGCPECARSFGPHYRGRCDHGETLCLATATREELAALYLEEIGYNPFEDDPDITEDEVRQTLMEYDEER